MDKTEDETEFEERNRNSSCSSPRSKGTAVNEDKVLQILRLLGELNISERNKLQNAIKWGLNTDLWKTNQIKPEVHPTLLPQLPVKEEIKSERAQTWKCSENGRMCSKHVLNCDVNC